MSFDNNDITLVLCAYRTGGSGPVESFIKWNERVFLEWSVKLVVVSDEHLGISAPFVTNIVYPGEQEIFGIPRTINYGIKRVPGNGIIAKTDLDIVFSSSSVGALTKVVCEGRGLALICANVRQPPITENKMMAIWPRVTKRVRGKGACFAMAKSDWYKLKGYNEEIHGWGADDNDMWERARKALSMKLSHAYPIFHVNHKLRKGKRADFPILSKRNLGIMKKRHWNNDKWGEAATPKELRIGGS